jgi:amidohydrolase
MSTPDSKPNDPKTHDALATISRTVDALRPRLAELALAIHAHPELCYEERFAAERIAAVLTAAGLSVERGVGGMETALRARFGGGGGGGGGAAAGRERPARVAILAEYDALPEIGHACGHNLIAAGAVGAALALHAARDRLPGEVVFLGTPAEEGGGGKIRLLEAGAFEGVDAAMMFHPFNQNLLWQGALAMTRVDMTFRGRPSHAAGAPWDGSSALRAVIQTFNLIDSARVHLRDGARVHGIITDGGQAVNIIPERAACAFSVRALTASYLETVFDTVRRCAEAAAAATGTRLELERKNGYKDMRNNTQLARRFGAKLEALGVGFRETDPDSGIGSTDMGDVSYAVPAIHPYLAICDAVDGFPHQHAFVAQAASPRGIDAALIAAKALAATAWDVLGDASLRDAAHREHAGAQAGSAA